MADNPYQPPGPPGPSAPRVGPHTGALRHPQDEFVLAYAASAKLYALLLTIGGLISVGMFLLPIAGGQPLVQPPKWRFLTFLALPMGLGFLAMACQKVYVTPERIVSRHLLSRRELNRKTCRLLKADSASYWITDDIGRTKIRIHHMLGANAIRLLEEISKRQTIG